MHTNYSDWGSQKNPIHNRVYHSLDEIHNYFKRTKAYANDRLGDGKFSGSLYDIMLSAKRDYHFINTEDHAESISNIDRFFQRLKDGVDYKKPAIVPSFYMEPYGHMYPVVGYAAEFNQDGKVDFSKAILFLRDSRLQFPVHQDYDISVDVETFYKSRASRDILIIKP